MNTNNSCFPSYPVYNAKRKPKRPGADSKPRRRRINKSRFLLAGKTKRRWLRSMLWPSLKVSDLRYNKMTEGWKKAFENYLIP